MYLARPTENLGIDSILVLLVWYHSNSNHWCHLFDTATESGQTFCTLNACVNGFDIRKLGTVAASAEVFHFVLFILKSAKKISAHQTRRLASPLCERLPDCVGGLERTNVSRSWIKTKIEQLRVLYSISRKTTNISTETNTSSYGTSEEYTRQCTQNNKKLQQWTRYLWTHKLWSHAWLRGRKKETYFTWSANG